jgi:hypothetical protein
VPLLVLLSELTWNPIIFFQISQLLLVAIYSVKDLAAIFVGTKQATTL